MWALELGGPIATCPSWSLPQPLKVPNDYNFSPSLGNPMPGPRGDSQPAVSLLTAPHLSPHPTLLPSDFLPGEAARDCLSETVLLLGLSIPLRKSTRLAFSKLFLLTGTLFTS